MVERAQLPGPVATGEKRGSGGKTRSQKTPAETEALMQFTPEGHDRIAIGYDITAARMRLARIVTKDRVARYALYRSARGFEKAAEWHRARADEYRRQHAEKTKP